MKNKMRESEEYLRDNIEYLADGNLVEISNAEHAVKLAYKEGYLEAITKLTKKFKELQERHWMCTYKDVLYVIEDIDKQN